MSEFQHPKWLTVIIPVILTANIDRCLETLYKYTEKNSFYVYVIDQSVRGLDATFLRNKYENLMVIRTPKSEVHYTGNLGFAQATNLGISLVQTPYFMMLNDDVEMVSPHWWQGVLDTFKQVEEATPSSPAVIVCCASIRLADWSVGRKDGDDFDILPYKEEYSDADWEFLTREKHYVNEHLTIQPDSVFDGVTMYACVCDTQRFLEVGLLDDFWYPGGAEDYDYSAISRMFGYRSVATTKSWVWHWWSSTRRAIADEKNEVKSLLQPELVQGNLADKWGFQMKDGKERPAHDIWGVRCTICDERMVVGSPIQRDEDYAIIVTCPTHPNEKYSIRPSKIMPL